MVVECLDHVLVSSIWRNIFKWLDKQNHIWVAVKEIFRWIYDLHGGPNVRMLLESVVHVTLWRILRFCNDLIFKDEILKRNIIFEEIIKFSFNWFVNRNNNVLDRWVGRIVNPFLVLSL